MNPVPLQARSLLVKTLPGHERPFVLENLQTGRRWEFDGVDRLLDLLRALLVPGAAEGKERVTGLNTARRADSAMANFHSTGGHHASED